MLESLCSENDRKRNVGTTAHRPPSSESCLDVKRVTYLVSFRVKIHGRFPWLAGVSMSCSNAVRGHINTRKSHCDQLKSESLNNTQIQKTMRCCDTILLQSTGENAKIHTAQQTKPEAVHRNKLMLQSTTGVTPNNQSNTSATAHQSIGHVVYWWIM